MTPRLWVAPLVLAIACAHSTPPTPAESTALAVDSAGLAVDVISYVADHLDKRPDTTTVLVVVPDGGWLAIEAVKVTAIPVPQAVLAAPTTSFGDSK